MSSFSFSSEPFLLILICCQIMRSTISCHCRETTAYWASFAGFARFPNGLRGFFGGGASLTRVTISWTTSAGRETIFSVCFGGICRESCGCRVVFEGRSRGSQDVRLICISAGIRCYAETNHSFMQSLKRMLLINVNMNQEEHMKDRE